MDNIVNNYWVSSFVEVCVCEEQVEFRGGRWITKRRFVVVNTDSGIEEDISEYAAKAMCMTPDSVITEDNWEDFCTASGYFVEDN